MIRSKLAKRAVVGVVAAAMPLGLGFAAAAPAAARPEVCLSGPYGYASACVEAPGWVDWRDGPRGHGHGHWKKHWDRHDH